MQILRRLASIELVPIAGFLGADAIEYLGHSLLELRLFVTAMG